VLVVLELSDIVEKEPVPESLPFPAMAFDESFTSDRFPTNGVYQYLGNDQARILCVDEVSCLHEVGHHMNNLHGNPAKYWVNDVEHFILMCLAGIEHYFCSISGFPGVYGNPMSDLTAIPWGGYSELYAFMYEHSITAGKPIPAILQIYFTNYWNKGE